MADKTILILAANPSDTSRLRLPEEVREIQEGLALSTGRDRFKVVSQWAVRTDDLRRALLRYEPQLVHFSGHGTGEQGLVFETDSGKSKLVSSTALARLFRLCPSVECVLMNACYSEPQAKAIGKHIDYVVGMNDAIGDRASLEFAVGFYDALGYGRSVPDAYEFGLSAIDLDGLKETATPVLKVRKGVEMKVQGRKDEPEEDEPEEVEAAEAEPTEDATEDASEESTTEQLVSEQPASKPDAGEQTDLLLEEPEGLVPLDSPFYIERSPIETDCYEMVVRPGSLIRIKAPHQMGKTSLLMRTLAHAQTQGFETVQLNFQEADSRVLTDLNEFLQWFCSCVTEELDLEDKLANYWKGARGVVRRAQRYFERYILTELRGPLVLGLDEVDQVFEHPEIATDFFGMLRVWHEEGKSNPLWRNLNLVIVHSKEVYIPLSINRSPFNVGFPVELRKLNGDEVMALIDRHQLTLSPNQKRLLLELVGGHPYLLRVALYQLTRGRITLKQLLSEAPTNGGLFNDHLRRHLLSLETDHNLLTAFDLVIKEDCPVQIGSTESFKLISMGLVNYQGNKVVPMCGLYRQYFQSQLGN